MRKALLLTSVLLLSILLSACGDSGDSAGGDTGETPFEPITYAARFKASQFTEASICGGCHTDIYEQWQGSMHNNAMEDKLYQGLHALASKETNGAIDAFCTVCHTPIGTLSGEVPPLEGPDISDNSRDGVQCDFCHTVSGSTGIGNASFEFDPSDTKKGPFDDAISPFHKTQYSELHTKSEFCGMCHDVNHPINGVALEATYTEWKNSPYAEQGIQCQDCHMTPGPLVEKPNPGKAATMGPERPHIWTHNFVGGNATEMADENHQNMAEEQLKAAAALSIAAPSGAAPGGTMQFQVDINNKGAGHYLPTGLTEVRQMWLEVAVTDANGKQVYHSGGLDETGNVDPDTVIYQTIFEDEEGNATHLPWEAVKVLSDNRVPPMGTVSEPFTITLPADAALPLTITAKLNYQTAPQSMVDELLGDEAFDVPVIEMVIAEISAG